MMVFLQDCCSWVSLLELGRPREGRTVVGRESQKKKEGAGSRGVSGRPARSWLAGAVEAAVKEKKKGKPAGREERKMVSGGGKRKSKTKGGRGNVPLVCRIEGGGERLLWEKRKNQKGLFGLFLAGRRTNEREGGAAGGTIRERRKKIRAGGGDAPLGEDRFRSFLGFFLFCVVSP